MESESDTMEAQIDQAISCSDYSQLASVFAQAKQSLGQGEQRTLSAHFIKSALTSAANFLPRAFSSPTVISVMKDALSHLPTSVENAYDNQLRHKLFSYLVEEEEDFRSAANVLAGLRIDDRDDPASVYYLSPAEKTDVYVKVAECFLNEEDYVEAEAFVTKAGTSVESIERPRECLALILRFKSVYARVLDANRKFLQAASRYYDLSQANNLERDSGGAAEEPQEEEGKENTMVIDEDDLLEFLGRAATCSILAPSGSQRQRILGLVYKDARLAQLDSIQHFKTHRSIVTKMYKNQIIESSGNDLKTFTESLGDHQKAIMSDGLTFDQRALIEHNMVAVSRLYTSIYFTDLAKLLGLTKDRAEKIACKMILSGNLVGGTIDEVDGILNFDEGWSEMVHWDSAITSFCSQLNRVTDAVRQNT